jgi:uncharacterized protein (TIGR03118 family)
VAQPYRQTNLVSDIPNLAATTDTNLVNPWGLTRSSTSPWWVADNGTGVSTLYNGAGQPFPLLSPLVVTIPPPAGGSSPAAPTGAVFNGSSDFEVASGFPGRFIFVTEEGTISAWNPAVDPNAMLEVDNSSSSAIYKGATIAANGNANYLYVANFHGGSVEVFDTNFNPFPLAAGPFTDPSIPAGFAPFNVQNINGNIYVAFAMQDAEKEDEVAGPGLGFVDAFDPGGNLLMRLRSGWWMDAPWGMVLAPADFGKFSHHLLVGNFGSGRIAAFDPRTGQFRGLFRGPHALPITIEGLWALSFGNGAAAGPVNTLFFTAGIDEEQHGLFGTLTPIPDDNDQGEDED